MTPIPVTILTGFLGAGKTTLLNALLRDPAFAETAVLINEFGNVQIDHDLVAEFSPDLITTTTGCLCCTASSEIKQSLFDLWTRRKDRKIGPFKRVIVETTGLVDPVPVVAALLAPPSAGLIDRVVTGQFALARVITLYDVINGAETLDRQLEALKQIALADTVVLTKTDLASAHGRNVEAERARIGSINPSAVLLDRAAEWSAIRDLMLTAGTYDLRTKGEDALAWLGAEAILAGSPHDHEHIDTTRHGDGIQSHVITAEKPMNPLVFHMFLDALKRQAGGDMLRAKGLFALSDDPDRPVVVHGVQHVIHSIDKLDRWPSDDKRTRFVVIGRNLNIDGMRRVLTSEPANIAGALVLKRVKAGLAAGAALLGVTLGAGWLLNDTEPTSSSPQSISHNRSTP